jgi:uncharacterized protein YhfF
MLALPPVELLIQQLACHGVALPTGRVTVDAYGDSEALCEQLLDLIRAGTKRAGTGLLWAYDNEGQPLPQAGDVGIVVNHRNEPVLLTRITRVEVVPFGEVTAEYAAIEGEGDGSLEYWRQGHWAFFGRECARLGLMPTERMPVVCSVFELLRELPPLPAVQTSARTPRNPQRCDGHSPSGTG